MDDRKDEMLDLLGSRIDALEAQSPDAAKVTLTPAETSAISKRESDLRDKLNCLSEGARTDHLMAILRSEMEACTYWRRSGDLWRERLDRANRLKARLEALCRELQDKNKSITEKARSDAEAWEASQRALKVKFETSLEDISQQLQTHAQQRLAQAQENDKLKEKLQQLIKYEQLKEEHFAQQLKTKELENQLLDAKLKQQAELTAQEGLRARAAAERAELLSTAEAALKAQLGAYADKFDQMKALLDSITLETDRMTKHMKKVDKDKHELELKLNAAQLAAIKLQEERIEERAAHDKAARQNVRLRELLTSQIEENKMLKQRLAEADLPSKTPPVPHGAE